MAETFVYLLRCVDESIYTGITTDVARRFAEHAAGNGRGAKYTAAKKPKKLELVLKTPSRSEALKLEYRIKTLTRAEKLRLIAGELPEALADYPFVRVASEDAKQP